MQLAKIISLLERIAYNTSNRGLEFQDYIDQVVYASSKQVSAEVHGDLRAQPTTRTGYVPEHDTKPVSRLRSDPYKGPAVQKKQVKKQDGGNVDGEAK